MVHSGNRSFYPMCQFRFFFRTAAGGVSSIRGRGGGLPRSAKLAVVIAGGDFVIRQARHCRVTPYATASGRR